jgi:hypothetical protein
VQDNGHVSEGDSEKESESESNENPPLHRPPDRAARRRATQAMLTKAYENGAIIDGTTVFTFKVQPQSSSMSTTTTYDATFEGRDGRRKNVFVGLFRAASGGGNPSTRKIPHTSHMPAYAHTTVFAVRRLGAKLEDGVAARRNTKLEVHLRVASQSRLQ